MRVTLSDFFKSEIRGALLFRRMFVHRPYARIVWPTCTKVVMVKMVLKNAYVGSGVFPWAQPRLHPTGEKPQRSQFWVSPTSPTW